MNRQIWALSLAFAGVVSACEQNQKPPAAVSAHADKAPVTVVERPTGASDIRGTLDISPEFKSTVGANDVVFLIARKSAGGPPLAAKKLPATFPQSFSIGQADVMMGGAFDGDIDITARLDRDGDAMTKTPADLIAKLAAPVKAGASNLALTINEKFADVKP